jgi:D-alanyl-D-alanine carboxypeptidase
MADVVDAVDERLDLFDGIATGVIVLVRVGDETAVTTRGQAVRGREDMSGDGTWPIASITKMMTATLVLQLVDEGLLSLGDDVRQWLPELDALGPVTVEQLLSHRAGLVSDPALGAIKRVGFSHTADILRLVGDRGPEYAAGSEGRYSNAGFAALGVLVERVLDQPFGEALSERIFEPTGMASSRLGGRPTIQGYNPKPVRNYYLGYLPGAGSVVSTAADVDAFIHALWSGDVLDPELVDEMRESRGPVQVSPFLRRDYGLGVMHETVSCGDTVGHSGRIGGFTDEAWALADGSRSVVVTVNDQDADSMVGSVVESALCG